MCLRGYSPCPAAVELRRVRQQLLVRTIDLRNSETVTSCVSRLFPGRSTGNHAESILAIGRQVAPRRYTSQTDASNTIVSLRQRGEGLDGCKVTVAPWVCHSDQLLR